jgi:hypothetical protein
MKTMYKCGVCEKLYDYEIECIDCEKKHNAFNYAIVGDMYYVNSADYSYSGTSNTYPALVMGKTEDEINLIVHTYFGLIKLILKNTELYDPENKDKKWKMSNKANVEQVVSQSEQTLKYDKEAIVRLRDKSIPDITFFIEQIKKLNKERTQ